MEINEREFFTKAFKLIQGLLDRNASKLDSESIEAVQHYISHDEYEMAFEGLFIDLMALGEITSEENLATYVELGKKMALDQSTVFDGDFWSIFMRFVEKMEEINMDGNLIPSPG